MVHSIKLTDQTDVASLRQLFQAARDAGEHKLRVGEDAEGNRILYTSRATSNIFSRLFGFTERRREEARAAVAEILGRSGVDAAVLGNIRESQMPRGHEFRLDRTERLLRTASSYLDEKIWAQEHGSPRLEQLIPRAGLAEDNSTSFETQFNELADAFGADGTAEAKQKAAKDLAESLSHALASDAQGSRDPELLARVLRLPVPMVVHDLRERLMASGMPKQAADQAITAVLEQLAPARLQRVAEIMGVPILPFDSTTGTLTTPDGRQITRAPELLGNMVNGEVGLYPGEGPDGRDLALKRTFYNAHDRTATLHLGLPSLDEAESLIKDQALMFRELMANMSVREGGPHAHVLGVSMVALSPEGHALIGMDVAPGGSANKAVDALNAAREKGEIPPERLQAVGLLLTKDMLRGMAHLHGKGVAHLDLKPANMFLDGEGRGKIADFASLTSLDDLAEDKAPGFIDQPRWKAPEFIMKDRRDAYLQRGPEARQRAHDRLIRELGEDAPQILAEGERVPLSRVSEKSDIHSIGVSAFEFLQGRRPFDDVMDFRVMATLAERSGLIRTEADIGVAVEVLGLKPIPEDAPRLPGTEERTLVNNLLNALLHPDPARRPKAEEALRHEAFAGLDEEQARADLRAILAQA